MKLTYPAIFYENGGEDGYTVVVPDLPGCCTYGFTLPEAIMMGTDAASGWVLTALEEGRPAPKASRIEDITPDPQEEHGFVSMLMLDMAAYAEKYGEKVPQKSLTVSMTIPEWLNTFAEEKQIDYSKTLQDSLTEIYARETMAAYG